MKKNYLFKSLGLSLIVFLCLVVSQNVFAEIRWLDETFSTDLSEILRDDIRSRIYLADSAAGKLVVIDSETEQIIKKISVGISITDMAISKDGRWLDVVANGDVKRIDLNRLKLKKTYRLPNGKAVRSVAFNFNGLVYAVALNGTSQYDYFSEIYVLNKKLNDVIVSFGVGPNMELEAYKALLETDSTGTILYVGETGLSPLSIYKIDISIVEEPEYIAEDDHGALGSNLKDIAISPIYNEIYVSSGSPYGIQVVDADAIDLITLLWTDAYPCGVDVSPLGDKIYGIASSPYNNYLYEFDTSERILLRSIELESQVLNGRPIDRGLTLDRFGEKAFIIHGNDHPSYLEMKVQVIDL